MFDSLDHLRDYQCDCVAAIEDAIDQGERRALFVMPTGCGKTQTFLTLAGRHAARANTKALVIAHRQELIQQPFDRWLSMTGEYAEMEMGGVRRDKRSGSPLIVASKDSLHKDRLVKAFPDPREVGMLIIDEAHRGIAKNASYSAVVDYFARGNPDFVLLGATATPDRSDEEALGSMFGVVPFDYPIFDPAGGRAAINDGWLVPLRQEIAVVENVELDLIPTVAGDLKAAELERQMASERPLHRITGATSILCYGEKSLIFTAGTKHAAMVAEILNRDKPDSAYAIISGGKNMPGWVVDAGDSLARKKLLRRYASGGFPYLVNMGVLTEGFDDPGIFNLVMGRPTKSRALYAQMVGRGTRILPNVIEGKRPDGTFWRHDREDRLAAIADSPKSFCRVVDFSFTGNTKHSLISSIDILGGNMADAVVDRAAKNCAKNRAGNVIDELKRAASEIEAEKRSAIRSSVVVHAEHGGGAMLDPNAVIGQHTARQAGWDAGKKPTERQVKALEKFGLRPDEIGRLSFGKASKVLGTLIDRARNNLATYRQTVILMRNGIDAKQMTRAEASARIETIFGRSKN